MKSSHTRIGLSIAAIVALGLSACSVADQTTKDNPSSQGTVKIMTHDSFSISDELKEKFEKESGYTLQTTQPGDSGAVVNQLILQKDQPTVDGVYGIDSYSAENLVDEGILADFEGDLPEGADALQLEGEGQNQMVPIDQGQVCVNVDNAYFENNDLDVPEDLEDLKKPEYAKLFATIDPTSSSPGLAFLVATVTELGDDWQGYWEELLSNGARVAPGWSAAYYEEFSATSDGQYPLVLSYSSSPSAEDGATSVVNDTCTTQVEYAGVLAEGDNPEGAQAFIDFLLQEEFQTELIENMYMYPVDSNIKLPEDWAKHATLVEDPIEPDLKEVAENNRDWMKEWSSIYEGQK